MHLTEYLFSIYYVPNAILGMLLKVWKIQDQFMLLELVATHVKQVILMWSFILSETSTDITAAMSLTT